LILTRLTLFGFRNLREQRLLFGEGIQLLVGGNAQGKTNLMEAIYCLSAGRSFRSADDSILVGEGVPGYRLACEVIRGGETLSLLLIYDRERRQKTLSLNQAPLRRVMELWAEIKAVCFIPADSQMVKGPPLYRRQFMNRFLAQRSALYRYHLQRFSVALRQRNAILRAMRRGERGEGMEVWTQQYAEEAQLLMEERDAAIRSLNESVGRQYQEISPEGGEVLLQYQPSSRELAKDLSIEMGREILAGTTLIGPHLDELAILLNGKPARAYSSEGEARSLALALRLAEYQILALDTGEAPLLLLDDAFSELDEKRREALFAILAPLPQVFLTTALPSGLPHWPGARVSEFRIRAGAIETRSDPPV
jgi:DNA replication and repair protein RecF